MIKELDVKSWCNFVQFNVVLCYGVCYDNQCGVLLIDFVDSHGSSDMGVKKDISFESKSATLGNVLLVRFHLRK